jgi:FdhD protein
VRRIMMLFEYEILRFNKLEGDFTILKDAIAIEEETNLYINGDLYVTFHHSPSQIKELVIGFLLTEGIIEKLEDVCKMEFSGKNIYIELSEEKSFKTQEKHRLITTFCGGSGLPPHMLKVAQKLRFNKIEVSGESILKAVNILNFNASIYRVSGGTHAAALTDKDGELIAFAEDIGRHNAVDKVIGEAAIKGVDFSRTMLASSGRLTSEIVIKDVQMGIPILISLSAPTNMGVRIAESFDLTLIGFARGKRFNIYTSPNRIKEWSQRSIHGREN